MDVKAQGYRDTAGILEPLSILWNQATGVDTEERKPACAGRGRVG